MWRKDWGGGTVFLRGGYILCGLAVDRRRRVRLVAGALEEAQPNFSVGLLMCSSRLYVWRGVVVKRKFVGVREAAKA